MCSLTWRSGPKYSCPCAGVSGCLDWVLRNRCTGVAGPCWRWRTTWGKDHKVYHGHEYSVATRSRPEQSRSLRRTPMLWFYHGLHPTCLPISCLVCIYHRFTTRIYHIYYTVACLWEGITKFEFDPSCRATSGYMIYSI